MATAVLEVPNDDNSYTVYNLTDLTGGDQPKPAKEAAVVTHITQEMVEHTRKTIDEHKVSHLAVNHVLIHLIDQFNNVDLDTARVIVSLANYGQGIPLAVEYHKHLVFVLDSPREPQTDLNPADPTDRALACSVFKEQAAYAAVAAFTDPLGHELSEQIVELVELFALINDNLESTLVWLPGCQEDLSEKRADIIDQLGDALAGMGVDFGIH